MGTYYDEPILWRCVDIDENGPLMLSDKIISIKPFDVGGDNITKNSSQGRESLRNKDGSNFWEDSNIRSWLNSTAKAGNVNWLCGNPPTADKVWRGYNAYADEKVFLADGNFTESERSVIKTVTQKSLLSRLDITMATSGNEIHVLNQNIENVVQKYSSAYAHNVKDKMFPLDVKQLNSVYENRSILGDSYYIGQPTQKAVDNSEYKSDEITRGEN